MFAPYLHQALVLSRFHRYPVPRAATVLAMAAAYCALGAVLAVLAIPVLAILDALFH